MDVKGIVVIDANSCLYSHSLFGLAVLSFQLVQVLVTRWKVAVIGAVGRCAGSLHGSSSCAGVGRNVVRTRTLHYISIHSISHFQFSCLHLSFVCLL